MAFKAHYATSWDMKGAQEADVVVTQSLRDEDHMNDRKERDRTGRFTAPVVRVPAMLHPAIAEASQRADAAREARPEFHPLVRHAGASARAAITSTGPSAKSRRAIRGATLTLGGTAVPPEVVLGSSTRRCARR